jgi:hypothetical protein
MKKQFFSNQAFSQNLYIGPLASQFDAFAEVQSAQGYSRFTTKLKIRVISKFSQWLLKRNLLIEDVNEACINKYNRYRKKIFCVLVMN